jgi:phosphatidylinositol dimannoside acyltransferase
VVTYVLLRLAGALIPRLPLRLCYWLAERAGDLANAVGGASKASLQDNMRHVLGAGAEPGRLAWVCRQVYRNTFKNMVDMFRVPALDLAQVDRLVTVHGWEYVEQALARGKGIVFTSAHFGEMDIAAQIVACHGLRPLVLHEDLQPKRLYDYIVGIRATRGIVFVPIGGMAPLKQAIRTLRANGLVGVVADRDVTASGRQVRFFGDWASLPDGHVTLALRTGATILVAFCFRRPGDTYEVRIEPPIFLEPSGDMERDVQAGTERVAAIMERYIGADPDQWVYFQPVWTSHRTSAP